MLDDDIAAALPELRAHAESMMRDLVAITRPGPTVTDPATGEVATTTAEAYRGKARIKPPTTAATESEVGTAIMVTSPGEVHIPVGSPYRPEPGDLITVLSCPLDPGMVVRKVTVRGRFGGSQITAYRIPVEEV